MTLPAAPSDFRKQLPTVRADAEECGWLQVAGRLQVPAFLARTRLDGRVQFVV
ncbi:hypothetical protein ACIQU6_44825 [Streptomyces sp. NPDC090442]|uniref:hypothetical protein n=1 Tax=Streptomyces sp. NPDC090442 TaxID=3365962 RepID=UPI0038220E71